MNLRQRLRQTGIKCMPWKIYKGEIEYMPISAKCLFMKRGIPIDLLEIEVRNEGYINEDEILLEVLQNTNGIYRESIFANDNNGSEYESNGIGEFPDNWTDEDYIHFYKNENIT